MPVMINLTSAEHGGTSIACGTHDSCGTDCNCGCPYTSMEEKGRVELIVDVERRYPEEWLAFVIPPGEDDFAPERGMLVVHSVSDDEVWDAVGRITHNQVVHVYYNGKIDSYMEWAEQVAA
jgi:hypothetical protein